MKDVLYIFLFLRHGQFSDAAEMIATLLRIGRLKLCIAFAQWWRRE